MAAPSGGCWVWKAAQPSQEFKHPADVPTGEDEATIQSVFVERRRGPATSRISQATFLRAQKGGMVEIAEKGVLMVVPKSQVLHWYEGLLLLDEIEQASTQAGNIQAEWWNDDLKQVLEKERKTRQLNAMLYTEKRLLKTAVTGAAFVDGEGKEWKHRREGLTGEEKPPTDGADGGGFFKMKEIIGYMPPWEAFADERCGFYQDFYQVRWEFPFSEVDYASVENGSKTEVGATWEPDECLPAHMDNFRLKAKREWIKTMREKDAVKKEQETKELKENGLKRKSEDSTTTPTGSAVNSSPPPLSAAVRRESEDAAAAALPTGKRRKDGLPLEQDILRCRVGHDFNPEAAQLSLTHIRSGWPKKAEDYPKGFGVAGPPGFCLPNCDCMDDQRPQRPWETRKGWLEEKTRSQAALDAMAAFSAQTKFVRRRGQVSKMFFFQSPEGKTHDKTFAQAAQDLGSAVEKAVTNVLEGGLPVASLEAALDPVRVPARGFVIDTDDYEPLRYEAALQDGSDLPAWVNLEQDDGRLVLTSAPNPADLPLQVLVSFYHAEGSTQQARCAIVSESTPLVSAPWNLATAPLFQKYVDTKSCPLERGVRFGLLEHFQEVYDYHGKVPRQLTLGAWLNSMSKIARHLRSASGANLALGGAPRQ